MNTLPKELEDIILNYKSQMEHIEMNKVIKELKITVKHTNYNNIFTLLNKNGKDIYYYHSLKFNKLIIVKNLEGFNGVMNQTYINYI